MLETKIFSFSKRPAQRHILLLLFALLLLSHVGSGCNSTSAKEPYENPEFGISLEKPTNWSLEFYERNGTIVLEAEEGVWNKSSARIEIRGQPCNSAPFIEDLEDLLEADTRRIRTLYDLDAVVVLQQPTLIENEAYEIGATIIQVPIQAMTEDSVRNQVGYQDIAILQTIDILAMRDRNNNIMLVYIYKGLSEELNAEAQAIVDSIKLLC